MFFLLSLSVPAMANTRWHGHVSGGNWQNNPISVSEAEPSVASFESGAAERLQKAIDQLKEIKDQNESVEKQIVQAQENLERLRAVSSALHGRYLLVNIPDFRLQLIENSKVIMTMRVVLGSTARPSPTFDSIMTHLVFSPQWNVPHAIAINDKLPLLKQDQHYLQKQGMKLYEEKVNQDGKMVEVDPLSIKWKEVSADNFPYRIVQDPSDLNSLGHVKFMFPNSNDVYMHDTPQKNFFKYAIRAFSSGCLRIEKPIDLAEYLLHDKSAWNRTAIISAMQTDIPKEVTLTNSIPIHVTYITAWVDENDQLQLRPDVYGKDSSH